MLKHQKMSTVMGNPNCESPIESGGKSTSSSKTLNSNTIINSNEPRIPSEATIIPIPPLDPGHVDLSSRDLSRDLGRDLGRDLSRESGRGETGREGGDSTPSTTTVGCSPLPDSCQLINNRPASYHGNNIYANTPTSKRFQSCNGQLNTSGLSIKSIKSPMGGDHRVADHSIHDLNSTKISPIARTLSSATNSRPNSRPHSSFLDHSARSDIIRNNFTRNQNRLNGSQISRFVKGMTIKAEVSGVKHMISSLGLLCLISLLLAFLSLIFLLKMTPDFETKNSIDNSRNMDESIYKITLAMISSSLSLNLCCLLVCSIQFLFAIKLASQNFDLEGSARISKYLEEARITRFCAIGGSLSSIPIFLTGIILYTFLHFDSNVAIITAILIGLGIIFIGAAVVHNVFIWQKEKMSEYKRNSLRRRRRRRDKRNNLDDEDGNYETLNRDGKSFVGLPNATLDLSCPDNNKTIISSSKGLELSTLV